MVVFAIVLLLDNSWLEIMIFPVSANTGNIVAHCNRVGNPRCVSFDVTGNVERFHEKREMVTASSNPKKYDPDTHGIHVFCGS